MAEFLLQHYLEASAEKYPDSIAVVNETQSLSYGMLDRISNTIARQLATLGLSCGETVGVYLPKSIEAVIAFHAIVKAGGAYIPLDAHFSPAGRIRRILTLSESSWLCTDAKGLAALCADPGTPDRGIGSVKNIILFDNLLARALTGPTEAPKRLLPDTGMAGVRCHYAADGEADHSGTPPRLDHNVTENDLAYILYTSGSTGDPKGVMITHRNAMTFVNWAAGEFSPAPGTVFANHAPFHFDLSVFDLYVAFAAGGSVHLVPPGAMNNPRSLVEWIDEHRIEIWYSVPSVWISIINFADIASRTFRHLRVVLFAGEVFPPKFLRELMRLLPGRLYYNLYGPTETNVCTYHRVHTAGEIGDAPVPIGKACANTGVMALDATLREVAVGQTGELHVFGPGVAKGYYRNAEKTAESFRRVTVAPYGERVIYSTGDVVVRIDADTYRYVGRKDFMVKCAGYRVELQEIERALDNHPLVRESAVVPRYREQRGSVALEAFVSLKPGAVLSIVDAKKFCGEKLPRYMIPETFRIIDEFPRNANGKIDRQLLQSGDAGQLARQGGA